LPARAAAAVLALNLLLLILSPKILSGDSSVYLRSAVMATDLVHPHHLSYNLLLLLFRKSGDVLGLAAVPFESLRAGMLVVSWVGIAALYGFLRRIGIGEWIAVTCAGAAGLSGLYWQFATQFEAYVPAFAALAVAAYVAVPPATGSRLSFRGRFGFAALAFAIATTLHQACAITVLGFALLFQQVVMGARRVSWTGRAMLASTFAATAGLISLTFYIIGWLCSAPGMGFRLWLTKYAHWEGMPWGLMSNFSADGVKQLIRSWGSSWLNLTPAEFYFGIPPRQVIWLLPIAGLLLCSGIVCAAAARRNGSMGAHLWWCLVWLMPLEVFILWWTPFLKNFQAIALLPEITIIAIGLHIVARWLTERGTAWGNRAVIAVGVLFWLYVGAINFRKLIVPGLAASTAPAGDLLLTYQMIRPEDKLVLEWPQSNLYPSLFRAGNSVMFSETVERGDVYPNWKSGATGRMIFHRGCVFYPEIGLQRSRRTYEQLWYPVLKNLFAAAGSREALRGNVSADRDGLLLVAFGTDGGLPLTYDQMMQAIVAQTLAPPSYSHRNVAAFFEAQLSPMYRQRAQQQQQVAVEQGKLQPVFAVPFVEESGKALWHAEQQIDKFDATSSELHVHTTGTDAFIWMDFAHPTDLSMYSMLSCEASITSGARSGERDRSEYHLQVFFRYVGGGLSEDYSVMVPLSPDGQRHEYRMDLWAHPFFKVSRKLVGLRVDTSGVADADVRLYSLAFRTDSVETSGSRAAVLAK
jgi:hypothetical protein